MANVGKNIKQIRTQKKMTQDDLADKLFVSRQTISNYETGRSNPDIDMLIKIADILETDVNILIFGIPIPPDKKREYVKLAILAAVTLLLSIGIGGFSSFANEYRNNTFDPGLLLVAEIFLRPMLLLTIGYVFMQAAGVFFHAKPLKGRFFSILRYVIIIFIVTYSIIIIPFCLEQLFFAKEMLRLSALQINFSSSQIRHFLPEAWKQFVFDIFFFHTKFSFPYPLHTAFFLLGIGLWGTGHSSNKTALPETDL